MGRRIEDTTVAVGEYAYGSGGYADAPEGYHGGPAVLQRVLPEEVDGKPQRLIYQYRVVLGVSDMWKAQAIAAILNAR